MIGYNNNKYCVVCGPGCNQVWRRCRSKCCSKCCRASANYK